MCPVNATLAQIMSFAGATEMLNFLNVIKKRPGLLRFALMLMLHSECAVTTPNTELVTG